MKKLFLTIAIATMVFVACDKENIPTVSENGATELVPVTFSASVPGTKTALDGTNVIWSAGDQLNVIEVDSDGNFVAERDFSIVPEDAGKASASFTGEVANASNTFYAIYPNIKMQDTPTVGDAFSTSSVKFKKANTSNSAQGIANGFDSSLAIMSAKVAADGSMEFRHAGAFLKFTVNNDNISSIKIEYDGKARMFCGRQAINLETGEPKAVDGIGSDQYFVTLTPLSGTFTNGASYLIPINIRNSSDKMGTLTFTATSAGVSSSKKASFDVAPRAGNIYNLGTPTFSFSPTLKLNKNEITVTSYKAVSDTTVTGVYSLSICTDSDVSIACDGTVVTSASFADGAVTFSVSKNEGTENRDGSITLTLNSVPYVITVTQPYEGAAVSGPTVYTWDFQSWAKTKSSGTENYYYYDVTSSGFVETSSALSENELYFYKATKVESNSSKYYANISSGYSNGTGPYLLIKTTESGTLTIWATLNKKSSETGSATINVVGGASSSTADLSTDNGNYFDSSAELGGAKEFSFSIDGTQTEIRVYKTGSNGLRIFKVSFEED